MPAVLRRSVIAASLTGWAAPQRHARLQDLGEEFEEIEHSTFGEDGFSETVRQVVRLEKHIGIQSLAMFTAATHKRKAP